MNGLKFTVLGSGSLGNSTYIEIDNYGLLIDFGFGPKSINERLRAIGRSWNNVNAVLLTHTHSDHWNRHCLKQLRQNGIVLYAHEQHQTNISQVDEYEPLRRSQLLTNYIENQWFEVLPKLWVLPILLPHDAVPTFGFRIEWRHQPELTIAMGYLSDIGVATTNLIPTIGEVDLLALEFNHDLNMLRASRRPASVISRIRSHQGHLSNIQAAAFTHALLQRWGSSKLQYLIQLHLSRDCNLPEIATATASQTLENLSPQTRLVTAHQDFPTITSILVPKSTSLSGSTMRLTSRSIQPVLPGM